MQLVLQQSYISHVAVPWAINCLNYLTCVLVISMTGQWRFAPPLPHGPRTLTESKRFGQHFDIL